jgi:hypothetical protein
MLDGSRYSRTFHRSKSPPNIGEASGGATGRDTRSPALQVTARRPAIPDLSATECLPRQPGVDTEGHALGSLLWEDRLEFDEWHDDWRYDGRSLKLEFSRGSRTRPEALTLVIDPEHGTATKVAWCLSKRQDPADAAADLRCREGCPIRYIARLNVDASSHDQSSEYEEAKEIASCARARALDVVVWTALPSNLTERLNKPFSVQEAISHHKPRPRRRNTSGELPSSSALPFEAP